MKKKGKIIIFIILLLIIWIPMFQQLTGYFNEPILKGAFVKPTQPEISTEAIKTSQYQKNTEDYLNWNFGFRGFLIKIKNSWEYLLFNKINSEDEIAGKNGYIYSKSSIYFTNGTYYSGSKQNEATIEKILFLKENIEKHGGHLLVYFAPSKECIYPEFMPSSFQISRIDSSNYFDFVKGFSDFKIPFIDFSTYFKKIGHSSIYPIFTTTGFHWSVYTASLAQDSILKHMQQFLSYPMPSYIRKGIAKTDTAQQSEDDFEDPMNLLFSLNQKQYFLPLLEMNQSTLNNKKPKVIIIGDSFFWQIKGLKNISHIFSEDSRFWYYFSQNIPLGDEAGSLVSQIDVMKELESADFVLLAGSFGTSDKFPYGVTDFYINNISNPNIIESIKEYIKNDKEWSLEIATKKNLYHIKSERLIAKEAIQTVLKNSKFQLKAYNNKFVCTDAARENIVIADKQKASLWETFNIIQLNNNKCLIYSFENKFLSANLWGKCDVAAIRDKALAWEIFTKEELKNNFVAFKASNGKYLSVDKKTLQLFARSNTIGECEKFKFIPIK